MTDALPAVPDFDAYPITHTLTSAQPERGGVRVSWSDGLSSLYHPTWLRENASDPESCHPVSREQTLMLLDIPADLSAVSASVDAHGALCVRWSTGEGGRYHPGWLRAHSAGSARAAFAMPERVLWDGSFGAALPRMDGQAVLRDVEARWAWLTALHRYGAVILEDVGTSPEDTEVIPSLVGPIRETNFGRIFDVRTRPDVVSNAYTSMGLPVHVDLATRERMPGLQFLHCIENSADGGDSLLADGFRVAEAVRAEAPDVYAALTTIPMVFANKAADSDYRHASPMFVLDAEGAVSEVRWSPWLRAPLRASFDETDQVYRGLRMCFSLVEDAGMHVRVRLQPGELLCMDNRRLLHGRTGFDPATGGRWLRGCYVDREELLSQLRMAGRAARAATAGGPASG